MLPDTGQRECRTQEYVWDRYLRQGEVLKLRTYKSNECISNIQKVLYKDLTSDLSLKKGKII